jgi:hypothetical protein
MVDQLREEQGLVDYVKGFSSKHSFEIAGDAATAENVQALISSISDYVDDVLLEKHVPFAVRQEVKKELIKEFVLHCVEQMQKFRHIFKTELGSIYFMTKAGASLRVNVEEGELKTQPFCNYIVFLNQADFDSISAMKKQDIIQDGIIGKTIQTNECEVGLHPFEFEISGSIPIMTELVPGGLKILGDSMGIFASGNHLGHKISEVIK